jgi:Heavy metal binding domain
MRKRINTTLASIVIAVLALVFVEPARGSATLDGHHYQNHRQAKKHSPRMASRAGRRARAKRKASRRAVSYVCPMHPDIRERTQGTCPKCMMDLVAEPHKAEARHQSLHIE